MSKLSELYLQEQQEEFELELSYQEWLRDNSMNEPSELELNEMEQDFITKPYFRSNRILSNRLLNHTDINTRLGA